MSRCIPRSRPSVRRATAIAKIGPRSRFPLPFALCAALVVLLVLLAGCGTDSSAANAQPTNTLPPPPAPTSTTASAPTATTGGTSGDAVGIQDFSFSPSVLSVKVGTTVTWTYDPAGGTHHTVTSNTGAFSSPFIEPGQTFSHTFTQAGTFKYHCSVHPSMTGEIDVTS